MLNRRQVDVQYQNLATMCRMTVKSLIDYACVNSHVDEDCEEFVNFCAVFEQMVAHRIRPYQKKVWHRGQGQPRHFWEVMLESHRHSPLFRSCIPNIAAIESIKSPKAKLRAFVRVALMEKRLSDYLQWLQNNRSLMDECYLEGALFTSEEGLELCGDIIGLSAIDFNFCLRGNENELLGPLEINYVPFLQYTQCPASRLIDEEEMLQLSGKMSQDGDRNMSQSYDEDRIKLQTLERDFRGVKEQKDYLEELVRLRERQMGEANMRVEAMRSSLHAREKEWEAERAMLDTCVLELQEEISTMRSSTSLLKSQISELQLFKTKLEYRDVQMVDLADVSVTSPAESRDSSKEDADHQAEDRRSILKVRRDFAKTFRFNNIIHWLRSKRSPIYRGFPHSLPMSSVMMKDSSSTSSKNTSSDQRSILSGISDQIRLKEDTQSLVPLTGSLADVNIAMIRDNQQQNEESSSGDWKRAETGSDMASQGRAKDRDGFVNVELTLFDTDDQKRNAEADMTVTPEITSQSSATLLSLASKSSSSSLQSSTKMVDSDTHDNSGAESNSDESFVVTEVEADMEMERSEGEEEEEAATNKMISKSEELCESASSTSTSDKTCVVVSENEGVSNMEHNVSQEEKAFIKHDEKEEQSQEQEHPLSPSASGGVGHTTMAHALQDLEKAFDTAEQDTGCPDDGHQDQDAPLEESRISCSSRESESSGGSANGSHGKGDDTGVSEPEILDKGNSSSEGSDAAWELLSDADESDKQ